MSRYLSDIISFFDVSSHYTVVDDRSEILPRPSLLEPGLRHRGARTCRAENIGNWLPETNKYRSWCDGSGGGESDSNETFLCYRDPGVCETCVCSPATNTLCDQTRSQNFAVACFYFDFAPQKEQTPTSVLGSLLKHVIGEFDKIPEGIVEAFRDRKKAVGGRKPRPPEIAKMFQTTSTSQRTFICTDTPGECVTEHRPDLLDSLREIVLKPPGTQILPTERPYILDEIEKRLAGRATFLSLKASKDDIIRHIRARLTVDTTPEAMDSILELDILENIPETISEIFLLVSLKAEATLQEAIIYRRRQKLSAITNGLSLKDVYGVMLDRIKVQISE